MARLQFGEPEPGVVYRDRPACYGLLERNGRLALVHVTPEDEPPFYDIPGGGLDDGETEAQALVREFGEETGLIVRPGGLVTRADQYVIAAKGQINSRNGFFEVGLEGEGPELKIEDDHELVWAEPQEALILLRFDSRVWAVAAWLRRRSGAPR